MKVVVVTGGIGSGKSVACRFLSQEYGWPVYCADDKVKELYYRIPELVDEIEQALKGCFRDAMGCFVPSLLAAVIFSDREALRKVEALVFPRLMKDFDNWKSEYPDSDHVILESATILEKPELMHMGDITILVDAPIESRVTRAAERDGTTSEAVRQRMKNQRLMNDVSELKARVDVDYLIVNDSTETEFYEKLRKIVEKIS